MSHLYSASALLLLSLQPVFASPVAQPLPDFQLLSSPRSALASHTGKVVALVGAPHRPRPALVHSLEDKLDSFLAKPTRGENPSTLVGDPYAFAPFQVVASELPSVVLSITSTTTSTTTSTITPSSPAEASIAAIQYKSIGSIATEVAPLAAATPAIFVDPLLPILPTPAEVPSAILSEGAVADIATPLPIIPVVASNVSLSSLNASVAEIPSVVGSATALPLAAQNAVSNSSVVESVIPISSVVETVTSVLSAVESVVPLPSVIESNIPSISAVESATPLPSVVESVVPLFISKIESVVPLPSPISVESDVPLPPVLESAFPEVPIEEVLGPTAGALELTDFVSLVQKIADVISGFFHVLPPTADTPENILAPPASEFEAPTDDILQDDSQDAAGKTKRDQQYLPIPLISMALMLETLRDLTDTVASAVPKTGSTNSELPLSTVSGTLEHLKKRDTLTAEQQSLVSVAAAKIAELQLVTDALKALAERQLTKREQESTSVDATNLYPAIMSMIHAMLTALNIPTEAFVKNLAVNPVMALSSAVESINGKMSAQKRQIDQSEYKDLLSKFIVILNKLLQVTKNVSAAIPNWSGIPPITPANPFAGGPFSSWSGLTGKPPVGIPSFVGAGGPFAGRPGGLFSSLSDLNGNIPTGPPFLTGGPLIAGPLAAISAITDKTPVDIASILAAPLAAASTPVLVPSALSAPLASASSIVVTLPDLPISSGSIKARGGSLRARQAPGLLSSLQDLSSGATPAAGIAATLQNVAGTAQGVAGAQPLNGVQTLANPAQVAAGALPVNSVQNPANPAQAVAGALPSGNILPLTLPAQSESPVAGLGAGLIPGANPATGALNSGSAGLVGSSVNPLTGLLTPAGVLSPPTWLTNGFPFADFNPFTAGVNPLSGFYNPMAGFGGLFGAFNPNPFVTLRSNLLSGFQNSLARYTGKFPTANLNPATGIANGLVNPVAPVKARDIAVTGEVNALPPLPPLLDSVAPDFTPDPAQAIGQGLSALAPLPVSAPELPNTGGSLPLVALPPSSLPLADSPLPLEPSIPPLDLASVPLSPAVPPVTPDLSALTAAPLAVAPVSNLVPSLPNTVAPPTVAAPVLNATASVNPIVVSILGPLQTLLNRLRNVFGIHTAQTKRDTSVSAFPVLHQDETHASLMSGEVQSVPNNAAHIIKAPAQEMSPRQHEELTRSSQAPLEERRIVQAADVHDFIEKWHIFSAGLAETNPELVDELMQVFIDSSGSTLTPETLDKYPEAFRAFIAEFYGFSQLLNDDDISRQDLIDILRALFLGLTKRNMRNGARSVALGPTPDYGPLLDDMPKFGEDGLRQYFGPVGTLDPLEMLHQHRRYYLPEVAPASASGSLAEDVDQVAPSTEDAAESEPPSAGYADEVPADASSV